MEQLSPRDLADWLDASRTDPARPAPYLLDVRETWEVEHCPMPGAESMPMATIPARLDELPQDRPLVCICHHGVRSQQVAYFLERQGFTQVINMQGGVAAWADLVDPSMPRY